MACGFLRDRPQDAIIDAIAGRQNQDRGLIMSLPQGVQDLQPASAGKHQIQNDQVEHLGIRPKKPLVARSRDDDVVVIAVQG